MLLAIAGTAVARDWPMGIITVSRLLALLDGSNVISMSTVVTWTVTTLTNIFTHVIIVNIADIVIAQLATVNLMTKDVIMKSTD